MIKSENVSRNIAVQGTSEMVPLISSITLTSWAGGGWMRSRLTENVIIKQAKAITAKSAIVHSQPCCRLPCPKRSTNGSVRPCTINWAIVTATKRMVVMLVRSRISLVMTPPNDV